jgi:hypothetical protein
VGRLHTHAGDVILPVPQQGAAAASPSSSSPSSASVVRHSPVDFVAIAEAEGEIAHARHTREAVRIDEDREASLRAILAAKGKADLMRPSGHAALAASPAAAAAAVPQYTPDLAELPAGAPVSMQAVLFPLASWSAASPRKATTPGRFFS